mmetsp:Transcript_7842/g.27397  ORF Transcript_7842/g.27397 Transcript_7842/m.27397 type:complete len:576 (-) Transcript_7842:35-1762(-)
MVGPRPLLVLLGWYCPPLAAQGRRSGQRLKAAHGERRLLQRIHHRSFDPIARPQGALRDARPARPPRPQVGLVCESAVSTTHCDFCNFDRLCPRRFRRRARFRWPRAGLGRRRFDVGPLPAVAAPPFCLKGARRRRRSTRRRRDGSEMDSLDPGPQVLRLRRHLQRPPHALPPPRARRQTRLYRQRHACAARGPAAGLARLASAGVRLRLRVARPTADHRPQDALRRASLRRLGGYRDTGLCRRVLLAHSLWRPHGTTRNAVLRLLVHEHPLPDAPLARGAAVVCDFGRFRGRSLRRRRSALLGLHRHRVLCPPQPPHRHLQRHIQRHHFQVQHGVALHPLAHDARVRGRRGRPVRAVVLPASSRPRQQARRHHPQRLEAARQPLQRTGRHLGHRRTQSEPVARVYILPCLNTMPCPDKDHVLLGPGPAASASPPSRGCPSGCSVGLVQVVLDLRRSEVAEDTVLAHHRQLNVVLVHLAFEALSHCQQRRVNRVVELHLVRVPLLQKASRVLVVLADGRRLPAVEGARGVDLEELRALIVVARHQARHAKGPNAARLRVLLHHRRRVLDDGADRL